MEFSGSNWHIEISTQHLLIKSVNEEYKFFPSDFINIHLRRSFFGLGAVKIYHRNSEVSLKLKGLSRSNQKKLDGQIIFIPIKIWNKNLNSIIKNAQKNLLWISHEQQEQIISSKPSKLYENRLNSFRSSNERNEALASLRVDIDALINSVNQKILVQEMKAQRKFFNTIEKSPLTEEQIKAVVSYDNRVQVVAAAGSGKTSVMVARTAYAIHKQITEPSRILLLAFNKDAQTELQERIDKRLQIANISSEHIQTSTFHALGLEIIGKSSGKKPRVAPWVTNNNGVKEIVQIIEQLCKESVSYRRQWNLFKFLWGLPLDREADAYDSEKRRAGYQVPDGKIVKSEGELIIATWLWLNGISYEYEKAYTVDTADQDYSQYHPDFYYPYSDSWHEHWGIDANGQPSKGMGKDYLESMNWKKEIHLQHSKQPLIETTWHEITIQNSLSRLHKILKDRGHKFSFDENRKPVNKDAVLKDEDLARLIRTFMTHLKSNSLDQEKVNNLAKGFSMRARLFLRIFWPILNEWEKRLQKDNYVDFEDMLVRAADILESEDLDL